MKALCFDHFGAPDVLQYRDLPDPVPGNHQALVQTAAIGLNFADIYRRKGNYHLRGKPPFIAGYEAAGTVLTAPPESGFVAGQRVGFADMPFANAERVAVDVDKLIALPDDIPFGTAAAVLLQGLTAQYLARDSHGVRRGESILVHAAAGGVGLLLTQLCRALGARVIGMTSSTAKAQQVLDAGADAALLYDEDWVAAARAFGGAGVDAVYDSVGATLTQSLEATRIGGHVVFYGMAGGDPAPVDPRLLMDTSKTLTGGDLWNVLTGAEERRRRAAELFGWVRDGLLKVHIDSRFPLAEGALAHARIESRASSGKVLLIP
ncbi:quinone oxidoreductase [Dokdonella soli]|uniref:Quinone oxidoreductase n=1 Tax=Dokdonella soli TaxID=529810 RepID=A0ABN1IC65_9GAMM